MMMCDTDHDLAKNMFYLEKHVESDYSFFLAATAVPDNNDTILSHASRLHLYWRDRVLARGLYSFVHMSPYYITSLTCCALRAHGRSSTRCVSLQLQLSSFWWDLHPRRLSSTPKEWHTEPVPFAASGLRCACSRGNLHASHRRPHHHTRIICTQYTQQLYTLLLYLYDLGFPWEDGESDVFACEDLKLWSSEERDCDIIFNLSPTACIFLTSELIGLSHIPPNT